MSVDDVNVISAVATAFYLPLISKTAASPAVSVDDKIICCRMPTRVNTLAPTDAHGKRFGRERSSVFQELNEI
ncbi:hypothetical protein DXU04_11980 [Bradyrhizobium diazoefficiens]|uniref:Uncharacterized protein n=1 Tax=Bradyrhizobium diazoefficiens SEMIA 5080 TaxID=754504 RepID=A0A837C8C5_9BRAD|nr:hypothetical protein BJA5080_02192 [Bradyrhizobium diazoefficiens SEMIA 5080]KOY12350.1 hypothetical protein AF336_04260 [Bradyrhizobium diazoefficiens]